MVVKSLISDERYIWLRVPRTATYAYGKLFFPNGNYPHKHNSYYHETDIIGELIPAFSVVRNPHTRFVSSLKHLVKRQKENGKIGKWDFHIPLESIEILTEWLIDNISILKNIEDRSAYEKLFETTDSTFVSLFFREQENFVNFPNVKIFKFELLNEYNIWIENTLGYKTETLEKINSSADELPYLDFENVNFIKVTQQLFYNDYTVFDYPFQHLT